MKILFFPNEERSGDIRRKKYKLEWLSLMLSRDNLNEPAICFSDLQACEEFIRQMQYNIMLRQQTFFQFIIFTLVNDHFIV